VFVFPFLMQSISLSRFLAPVVLKFCIIASLSLVLGFAAGALAGWILAAVLLAFYVSGFVFALYKTLCWMESSQQTLALQAPVGEWNNIATLLYRARKLERSVRQELDQSVAQLRKILEQIPDGVVIVDAALNIQWANHTAEKHLGIDVQRDRGLRLTNLAREPEFIKALLAPDNTPNCRMTMAGSGLTLQVQSLAFSSDQSLIFTRDVSETERLDVMRRDFIANVSHELRTPLTVLVGFLEIASPLQALSQEHLLLMRAEALRMQRLIEDLLTLSRLEASHNLEQENIVELQSLAQRALSQAQAISAGKHIFSTNLQALKILGSEHEIESALSNLIINAVRYTPESGRISVEMRQLEEGVEINVIDSGVGIAPEHITRLTERFYRVDKSRSRETGGTGLGLAIVKHVMQRHQGQLLISSTLGQGSRFTLLFPRKRMKIEG